MSTPVTPAEIYVTDAEAREFRAITRTNPQAAAFALGRTKVITWKSTDGLDIEGVLLLPVDHRGWSSGGYMTAWSITPTTRFKAAMVGAGPTNLWSMYGTNDMPNVLTGDFGGVAGPERLPLYMERSAMTRIDRVVTPTLILHGGEDERVPVGQAQELFPGLTDRGRATELVFHPREGHGINE